MFLVEHPIAILLCISTLILLVYLRSLADWRARSRGRPLPPGPRRLPLLGNVLNAPSAYKPWASFRDLAQRYGDIVYLELLGRPMLILSSPSVLIEFLDKRSSITADRTESTLIALVGQSWNFAFMPYSRWWRRHRRAFWQQFHPGVVSRYRPMQQSMARDFLVRLSEKPTAWQELLRFYFTAAALKAVYNLDISDVEDSRVAIIENIFEGLREVTISAQFLLERVPLVQHLPTWTPGIGKFFKKVAASKAPNDLLMETEFAAAKERMEESGTVDASVVSQLLSRLAQTAGAEDDTHEEEVIASGVAAVAVEAGTDTTFSTSAGFFAAMVLHPEVQQKAQAELEAVVGQHRLPDFEDKQSLVYINAIVKEILRWHNVLPLGVSHRTTEDNELRGYFIPQGTMLTPAVWACMHDPEIYPDPDRFYPERFIRNGQLDPTVLDPADFVFGFGRRKCPGRHFAEAALFILIASVLHVFEIGSPKDEDGRPVKLEYEQSHGFLSYPENFDCTVKLRSAAEATSLIRDSRPQQDPI